MATGDIRIDALVEASRQSLATNHKIGTGAVITYSFLVSTPDGPSVYDFRSLDAIQKSAITAMLAEVASLTGVVFKEVSDSSLLQYGSYSGRPGVPSGPDNKAESMTDQSGSVVWLNWNVPEISDLGSGYGRQLVLHETAHALGLKHPEAYSGFDSGPFLPEEMATAAHTIMAYNGGNTEHLGDYDLLALQYLWGNHGDQPPESNALTVSSTNTTGSFFNDTFHLDITSLGSSVRVNGLAGIDSLNISADSASAKIDSGLQQITYTKADGSYVGVFLDGVERIKFTDKTVAIDIEGNAGQAYRLYKAAFDRVPDKGGLGYWIKELDSGASLLEVAAKFITTPEFTSINGATPTNLEFATSMYQHVLGRAPDQGGLTWWVDQLDTGARSKSDVLVGFSESSENQIALSGQVQAGIEYLPG